MLITSSGLFGLGCGKIHFLEKEIGMVLRKSSYKWFFVLSMVSAGLYGCGATGVVHEDKPPYYHGHIENEPPPRHQQMHVHEAPAPAPKPAPVAPDVCTASCAYPTNDKMCGSVIYVEKIGPCRGSVGQEYCYTIKITNLTKGKVKDVEVVQSLPKNFQVKKSTPEMEKGSSQDVAKWFLGEFNAEESREIRVCGIPTQSGHMPFCTDVAYRLPELCLDPIITEAKLTIARRAPSEISLCDVIPVTFQVTNTGTGVAKNIKVKESLPAGLATQDGKSEVTLDVGSLNPGESREVVLKLKAESTGEFKNSATVVADGNLKAESNTTITSVRQPVLAITKSGPEMVYVGRNITYNIEVFNKGNGPAEGVVVVEPIPENSSLVSAGQEATTAGNVVTWNIGTLAPQGSKKVGMTLKTKDIGAVKSTVTAKAPCATSATVTLTTRVQGISAVLLEVIDLEDPIEVGNNDTYEIVVTNQGSDTGTNIKIVCTLEAQMQYVSSTGPTAGTISADGKTVTFAPLSTLAPKAKSVWTVVVKAVGTGDIRFKASMTEDRLGRPVEETEATNFYK
ncbi:MAG: CARDB domain-containing protein [Planctomycetota bacterium]